MPIAQPDPRNSGLQSRFSRGLVWMTPHGPKDVPEGHAQENSERRARPMALGLPTWADLFAGIAPRTATPALLRPGLSLDEAKVAFGETYPLDERGVHELVDAVGVTVRIDHSFTLNHLISTEARRAQDRYQLIPLIRPSIEMPTEIWETAEIEKKLRRPVHKRMYLTLFDDLQDHPGGVFCVAKQVRVGKMNWRFTHITIYGLRGVDDAAFGHLEDSRFGRIVYTAYA